MAPKKKDKYCTRNWKEYNVSLVNRGSITFWFEERAAEKWCSVERTNKPGRPETYSDDEAMPYLMEALEGISLGDAIGDGAYNTTDCREAIHDRGGSIPFAANHFLFK